MIIIDAKDIILGRLATFTAKKALLGEEVTLINVEQAVITGNPEEVLAKYFKRRNMGAPLVGPYYPKTPERMVKRAIRGMLPYKRPRGREALAKIKCYEGTPKQFISEPKLTLDEAHVDKTHSKYLTILEISKKI